MGKRNRRFEISAALNARTFAFYYDMLKNLAINAFEWINLPKTVDERFLELCLFDKGYCLYFNDDIVGNLALNCTIEGKLDVYNIPTRRMAFANNGYNKRCTIEDSVLIFNNYLHIPSTNAIDLYALRLYEIERAMDVNIKLQKFPAFVAGTEQQRLTLENLMMKYDGNQPLIFGDNNLDLESLKTINFNAPYVTDKLIVAKHQVLNEALTFVGIENSNQDKKERLVADEVGSNYGHVEAQRKVMLNARQEAAEKINRMFGTDIEVRFRSNLRTMVNEDNLGYDLAGLEGDTDERIYNAD